MRDFAPRDASVTTSFVFESAPKIVCEDGAAMKLAPHLAALGVERPLVVTDGGLVAGGMVGPILQSLQAAGLRPVLFSSVIADPPEAAIEGAVTFAGMDQVDGVVGLGGGSAMDTAKLVALLLRSGEKLSAIYGTDAARGPRLPLIQVPTTAGTGSEVTPIAVVTTPGQEKKGVVSSFLYPDLAVIDATLTLSLPPAITAITGVDAMVHAIEAYTSRLKKNPFSDALAVAALKLLSANILRAVEDGGDILARRAMLQGAMLAGVAFANAPVAAVHALAYPIGGRFHVPHGLSNALMLKPVLDFNLAAAGPAYAELAEAVSGAPVKVTGSDKAKRFVDTMTGLLDALPIKRRLTEVGVASADIPDLARDAVKVQRLLVNNPRPVNYEDAVAIYREAM